MEVADLEQELFSHHPPRTFPADEPIQEEGDTEQEDEDDETAGTRQTRQIRTIVKPQSQPRRARPRRKAKVLKMTDFFQTS